MSSEAVQMPAAVDDASSRSFVHPASREPTPLTARLRSDRSVGDLSVLGDRTVARRVVPRAADRRSAAGRGSRD